MRSILLVKPDETERELLIDKCNGGWSGDHNQRSDRSLRGRSKIEI